jgi:hypothetical protein
MNQNFNITMGTNIIIIVMTNLIPELNKPLIKISILFFVNYLMYLNYYMNDFDRIFQSLLWACFGYIILFYLEKCVIIYYSKWNQEKANLIEFI